MFTQTFIPQKTIHTSNNYAKNTSTKATVTDFNTHTHKKSDYWKKNHLVE